MIDHALILIVAEITPTGFALICIGLGILIGIAFDFVAEWRDAFGHETQRRRETAFLRINAGRRP